jgi:Uma2 family endonuclease
MSRGLIKESIMPTEYQSPVKLGYDEFVLFPSDGNRHEIIDGRHYTNPAPSTGHQSASKHLQYQLYQKIELARLGKVFYAPIDVQLSDHDIVEPDLIVLKEPSSAEITKSRIMGPPELVIEILSPSTKQNDETLKRRLYEQSGVLEYWLVDINERVVTQLVLEDGTYNESPEKFSESIELAVLPEIEIDLTLIWQ